MNVYNWLLLTVPIIGVVGILITLRWADRSLDRRRLHPGE